MTFIAPCAMGRRSVLPKGGTTPNTMSNNTTSAIYEDQDQVMWFGTWEGLNRYDYKTNSFKRFQHN
ncbi:MAG: hypothetical protein DSY83_11545, partial [Flavobacteriia bacterium]